ncbi:MAG: hypothetical protein ACJAVN_000926 [Roseivirga sp.]|jgi:hypothetical protein
MPQRNQNQRALTLKESSKKHNHFARARLSRALFLPIGQCLMPKSESIKLYSLVKQTNYEEIRLTFYCSTTAARHIQH